MTLRRITHHPNNVGCQIHGPDSSSKLPYLPLSDRQGLFAVIQELVP